MGQIGWEGCLRPMGWSLDVLLVRRQPGLREGRKKERQHIIISRFMSFWKLRNIFIRYKN